MVLEWILGESNWLFASMLLASLATAALFLRGRPGALRAMNVFYGTTIGTMGAGHLIAVSIHAARGTLEGPLIPLLALGVVLVIPAWWLVLARDATPRRILALNGALLVFLLALGLHNWPIALPAALAIAHVLWSARRAVAWTLVTAAVLANGLLFVGSLIFYASGQSFEQFSER